MVIKNFFTLNPKCPLCGCSEIIDKKSIYFNVYSELLAKEINLEQDKLLENARPKKCTACDYLFWEKPISCETSKYLYSHILPVHPKGEDSTGKFFSVEGLEKKFKGLKLNSSKRSRIINGFLSSIKFENKAEKDFFLKIIFSLQELQNLDLKEKVFLKDIFDRGPVEYSRHAGFRNTFLNKFIKSNLKKGNPKFEYIEYGCSDWGPLSTLSKEGFNCVNIIPYNNIFWDCSHDKHIQNLEYDIMREKDNFNRNLFSKSCFLSLFLILDHLNDPVNFFQKFLKIGVSKILIMNEKIDIDKGLPIQHLGGWNEKSLIKLSKSIGFEMTFFDNKNKNYLFALLSKNNS